MVCLLVQPKDATPPNFAEKTLHVAEKTLNVAEKILNFVEKILNFAEKTLNFAKVIFLESFLLYSTSLSCVVTAYVSLVPSPPPPRTSLFAGTVREKELGAGKAWKWCYHYKQVL